MTDREQEKEQRRLNAIMATEDGRAWMWDHLANCGVFHSTYTQNPHDTAFNEGRRSIGLRLIADLRELSFKLYQAMEMEAMLRLEDEEVASDVQD